MTASHHCHVRATVIRSSNLHLPSWQVAAANAGTEAAVLVGALGLPWHDAHAVGAAQYRVDVMASASSSGGAGYPLTPSQQGILFHSVGHHGSSMYHDQLVLELRGCVDVERMRRAWEHATRAPAHGVLCAHFRWGSAGMEQSPPREVPTLPWEVDDWSSLDLASCYERLWRRLETGRLAGFDIEVRLAAGRDAAASADARHCFFAGTTVVSGRAAEVL